MQETGKAVVIPVILRPCDWHETLFGKLLATPKDGKAVVKYPISDEAFLEVTNEIKRVVKSIGNSPVNNKPEPLQDVTQNSSIRSSNLRIKKTFSDHDKDKFLDEAFEYMAKFFEGSLSELQKRNMSIQYRFKRIDSQIFTASVYDNGNVKTECTVFYGGNMFGYSKSINYSYSVTHSKNSFNESLSVHDDGYNLYLSPIGISFGRKSNDTLTFEGASEFYWELFIKRLQG